MSRVPATLLYLTIYNPSLQHAGPIPEDDEDAEEQAHILFYTSREKAVSRDRMLRQVGLAKALINFSELFNGGEVCSNVHSQSRRMVMIEPEPDFWIHAGIEVAKTPKPLVEKGKRKDKGKGKETKAQERENVKDTDNGTQEPFYDYHDASVHDLALRKDILRAYDQFKLTHGSFTSILSILGKEGLELQLERFFTVWAWSWNLEDGHEFGPHLGNLLHPSCRSLTPLIDAFASQLPEGSAPFVISPPFLIPSGAFTHARYPPTLPRYFMSRIPQHPPTTNPRAPNAHFNATAEGTLKVRPTNSVGSLGSAVNRNGLAENPSTFLGMPAMNMNNINMNMDVRKWGWPGYLKFGRNLGKKSPDTVGPKGDEIPEKTEAGKAAEETTDVDRDALEDAMSSDNLSILMESGDNDTQHDNTRSTTDAPEKQSLDGTQITEPYSDSEYTLPGRSHVALSGEPLPTVDTHVLEPSTAQSNDSSGLHSSPLMKNVSPCEQTPIITDVPLDVAPPRLSSINIYLADPDDTLVTRLQKLYYIGKHQLVVAIAGMSAEGITESELSLIAEKALGLLDDVENARDELTGKNLTDFIHSATNILEPEDKHIFSAYEMTVSSPGFTSKSEHLYNAEQLLEKDHHILEVFSRGQSPQHWHVGRRGLGVDSDGIAMDGEIYVEVSRKETSITDVDNVVALLLQSYQARST